jgi:hypothetical protein
MAVKTDAKAFTLRERVELVDWREVQRVGLLLLIVALAMGIGWAFYYASLVNIAADLTAHSLAVAGLVISSQLFLRRK